MSILNTISATLVMAVAPAPGSFAEVPISNCEHEASSHSTTRNHIDLGGGVVSYETGEFGHGIFANTVFLENCASGTLEMFTVAYEDKNSLFSRKFDVRSQTDGIIVEAARADSEVSFTEIRRFFRQKGATVKTLVSNNESCACYNAYPDLRGTKRKYDGQGQ